MPNRVRVIHDLQLKENTCFTNCYESFSVSKNKCVWELFANLNATIIRANIIVLSFTETKLLLYLFLKEEQWCTFEKKNLNSKGNTKAQVTTTDTIVTQRLL